MADLVTLGETMAVVQGDDTGRLRTGGAARFSVAGAEATVAIGVCRPGHTATWIGRVGDDALGSMIVAALRGEGVDVGLVSTDPGYSTGLMVRHRRTEDHTVVTYYREGLAGSRLDPCGRPSGPRRCWTSSPPRRTSFAGDAEAALILDDRRGGAEPDPYALGSAARALGPAEVVIKRGRDGAVAVTDAGATCAPAGWGPRGRPGRRG